MPMVAAVATLEPETAAKIAHEKTLATASPPGRKPTQRATAVKSPRPMPECRRIALMKTKSGTAMKEKLVAILLHSGIGRDRKSTRLNSSHLGISYAVFCLKKKKTIPIVFPDL